MSYKEAREKYRPKTIDLLWIHESPPVAGGYFYFEEAEGGGGLFSETMKALGWWGNGFRMRRGSDKRPYLRRFQQDGHFLIDLSDDPVNGLSKSERRKALENRLPAFLEDVTVLAPKHILIIKRNVFDITYASISALDFSVLNKEYIPFPGSGQQKRFRELVRTYLRKKPE